MMRTNQNPQKVSQDNNAELETTGKKRKKSGENNSAVKYVNKHTLEEAQNNDKDSMKVVKYLCERLQNSKAKEFIKPDISRKDLNNNTQNTSNENEQTIEEFLNEKAAEGYKYTNYGLNQFFKQAEVNYKQREIIKNGKKVYTYSFNQWIYDKALQLPVYKDNGMPVRENVDIGLHLRATTRVDTLNHREICTFKVWTDHSVNRNQDKPGKKHKKNLSKKDKATIYFDKHNTKQKVDSTNSNSISVAAYLKDYVLNQAVDANGKPIRLSNDGSNSTDAITFKQFLESKKQAGYRYTDSKMETFLKEEDLPRKMPHGVTTTVVGNTTYYRLRRMVNLRMRQQYVYKGGINDGLPILPDEVDETVNKVTYKTWYGNFKSDDTNTVDPVVVTNSATTTSAVTLTATTATASSAATSTTSPTISRSALFGRSADGNADTSGNQHDPEKNKKMRVSFLLN